ncbi:MAG: carbon storage regulator CsrA [Thermodesulforhabdaceae bacterium]|jgi:carbon storage regulator
MLILSRRVGEAIRIGEDIEIIVTEISQNRVKIGIKSPKTIPVYREELYQRIKDENRQAALVNSKDIINAFPLFIKAEHKQKEGE